MKAIFLLFEKQSAPFLAFKNWVTFFFVHKIWFFTQMNFILSLFGIFQFDIFSRICQMFSCSCHMYVYSDLLHWPFLFCWFLKRFCNFSSYFLFFFLNWDNEIASARVTILEWERQKKGLKHAEIFRLNISLTLFIMWELEIRKFGERNKQMLRCIEELLHTA